MKKINKEMKKVYVVGNSVYYAEWINNYILVDNLEDADIVLFTGGEDVDPDLYDKECHHTTFCNPARDRYEAEIFDKVKPNQVCLGICRGLKLLAHVKHGELLGRLRWLSAAKL